MTNKDIIKIIDNLPICKRQKMNISASELFDSIKALKKLSKDLKAYDKNNKTNNGQP